MRLVLEVLQGPDKGKTFQLKRSATLGRKGTDVVINDTKMSGIHAFLQFAEPSTWVLADNGSRNGVWVSGEKISKHKITDGMEFQIGKTVIRCNLVLKEQKEASDEFLQWFQTGLKKVRNNKCTLQEIKPALMLSFTEGIQYGTKWEIFYGPRVAGSNSLDLTIYDDTMPSETFVIDVKGRDAFLKTKHPSIVRVNGMPHEEKLLMSGDIIHFGENKILVNKSND